MHVQEPALTGAVFPDWCCMLFVLVIRKPLFVLWPAILKHKELIVNFSLGIR